MENAQLIGLSRQMVLRNQLDVVANNLANINTTGFRRERLVFEEYLMPVARANAFQAGNRQLSFVNDPRPDYDFSAGAVQQTGNPLDVAINGDGWFTVETAQGERYTRNGAFSLNADGELVTQDGTRVLGEGGPIQFGPTETDIVIGADGTISSSEGQRGRLRLVRFDNEATLKAFGENMFEGDNPLPATEARVIQGAIEKSNVKGVVEITRMIDITRTYVSVSKMLADTDDLREKAISRLARIEA